MNIFITHSDPYKCAKFLDNKRLVKMVLETAQILSTALHLNNHPRSSEVYKATHRNHPCVIWATESRSNWCFLVRLFNAYLLEYNKRFDKLHLSGLKLAPIFHDILEEYESLDLEPMTPFANCARNLEKGVDFKHIKDVHLAYRLYLRQRWKGDKLKPKWR